jgi:hypothetical protein
MKQLFPIALALGLILSLSGFSTVTKPLYTFPITGTTTGTPGAGQPVGTINYSISGSGSVPSAITFTSTSGTFIGTYPFSLSSPNNYLAGGNGMRAQTSITAVYFHISTACGTDYCIEWIGGL